MHYKVQKMNNNLIRSFREKLLLANQFWFEIYPQVLKKVEKNADF